MRCQGPSILIRLIVGKHFKQKEKWICISLRKTLIQIYTLKFLSLVYLNKKVNEKLSYFAVW